MEIIANEVLFLSGLVFLISSLVTYFFPPKKINELFGYRSLRSKRSQLHWDFAQCYASKFLIKGSGLLILLSFIELKVLSDYKIIIGVLGSIAFVILLVFYTEKALKEKFGT